MPWDISLRPFSTPPLHKILQVITSGDENHLCGASLRENHKISLKAQKHGASTPNYSSMSVTAWVVVAYLGLRSYQHRYHESENLQWYWSLCTPVYTSWPSWVQVAIIGQVVIFMLRDVHLPVMLIVDLSLAIVVQHSPFQFHALAYTVRGISVPELSFRSCIARDDHYLMRSKVNSLLAEMITPQTYIQVYIHIKTLPVPHVFGAHSGSPQIMQTEVLSQTARVPHWLKVATSV